MYAMFMVLLACIGSCSDKPEIETAELGPDEVVTLRISFVAAICGDAICKIEDPAYVGLGQRGFRYDGKTYDGVFKTQLPCPPADGIFQAQTALTTTVFRVKISKQPFADVNNACGFCMATFPEDETPTAFYFIKPL